jgi:uncharacterized membrane protein
MKFLLIALALLVPALSTAQEVHQELQETVRAEVLEVLSEHERDIVGTDATAVVQEVRVHVLEGEKKGEVATFENDLAVLEAGDSIYINRLLSIEGIEYYTFKDVDRRLPLITLGLLFVAVLLLFSGMHGIRALASLLGSVLVIFYALVPLLLAGYSPVLVSIGVSAIMLALVLYFTHGFTARTTIAFVGTLGAVICTGIIASIWVKVSHLTGLSSDESIYLNFSTKGALDFSGLLLGSIIIGVLGVLDDVAVTQASVVAELKRANVSFGIRELYVRAIRVGRDHIGSLVNTLALAYIGVSLPLVLLLAAAGSDITLSLNQEIVAAELIRTLVGSIGLILAVPFTTLVAAWWYDTHDVDPHEDSGHTHVH